MSNNSSAEDEDAFDDGIDIDEDLQEIESSETVPDNFDARRRLEEILENKALERLINGDLYDEN